MFQTPLDLAPLAVFAFGALTFSILAVFYWSTRQRRKPGPPSVLPAFTLVCAIAFLDSMVSQALALQGATTPFAAGATLIRHLTAGLLPPLILHLVLESESLRGPAHRAWHWLLMAFYVCAILPLLQGLDETGLLSTAWTDSLYNAPAAMLAVAAAAGLARLAFARRPAEASGRAYRRWTAALLSLMLVCAAASWSGFGAIAGSLPDYLLLLFFCVTLYYRERLVFFDVLIKRGVFLAAGLALLTLWLPSAGRRPWADAAGLLVCWLAAPWIYGRLVRTIDRVWLRRSWSPVEAERRFLREIQIAAGENDLRTRSIASLTAIFQAPAEVHLSLEPRGPQAGDESLAAELERHGTPFGYVLLKPRPNGIPFLSDDRRLVESLARALSVLVENVRFREDRHRQEERERDLRWLASRAELKALRAQIDPHFLFNALSVIAGLMHYQPELADETVAQLAQVFRYTLRKSESEWAPLSEEVEFVSAYLRIEQARFGERLRLEFDVDPAAAHFQIPAMSIQPLVENAIKHGVSAVEGCGTVGLRVVGGTGPDGSLQVEVLDNGPGFPADYSLETAGNSHGLRNVARRLRGYYGDQARLFWESGPQGTRVAFTIPQSAASGFRGESS